MNCPFCFSTMIKNANLGTNSSDGQDCNNCLYYWVKYNIFRQKHHPPPFIVHYFKVKYDDNVFSCIYDEQTSKLYIDKLQDEKRSDFHIKIDCNSIEEYIQYATQKFIQKYVELQLFK